MSPGGFAKGVLWLALLRFDVIAAQRFAKLPSGFCTAFNQLTARLAMILAAY